jgi:hypothetical protein
VDAASRTYATGNATRYCDLDWSTDMLRGRTNSLFRRGLRRFLGGPKIPKAAGGPETLRDLYYLDGAKGRADRDAGRREVPADATDALPAFSINDRLMALSRPPIWGKAPPSQSSLATPSRCECGPSAALRAEQQVRRSHILGITHDPSVRPVTRFSPGIPVSAATSETEGWFSIIPTRSRGVETRVSHRTS